MPAGRLVVVTQATCVTPALKGNGAPACLSRNYNVVVLLEGESANQPRMRMRPSWATVATSVPSSVNTRARARPRAPEADGDHWS